MGERERERECVRSVWSDQDLKGIYFERKKKIVLLLVIIAGLDSETDSDIIDDNSEIYKGELVVFYVQLH